MCVRRTLMGILQGVEILIIHIKEITTVLSLMPGSAHKTIKHCLNLHVDIILAD